MNVKYCNDLGILASIYAFVVSSGYAINLPVHCAIYIRMAMMADKLHEFQNPKDREYNS